MALNLGQRLLLAIANERVPDTPILSPLPLARHAAKHHEVNQPLGSRMTHETCTPHAYHALRLKEGFPIHTSGRISFSSSYFLPGMPACSHQ